MKKTPPASPSWASGVPTVGVTGTNGKTTTARFTQAALRSLGAPVAAITTIDRRIDDEVLELPRNHAGFVEVMRQTYGKQGRAVIELTSEALASGFIHAWPCQVGVFTNLSHDHLDAHQTAEHYLASKAQLFAHLENSALRNAVAVLNAGDPAAELLAGIVPKGAETYTYLTRSRGAPWATPDVTVTAAKLSWSGSSAELSWQGALAGPKQIATRGIGEPYLENALAALLAAIACGADSHAAAQRIASCPMPAGRSELLCERPWVVVDYAHSPDALARTLAALRCLCTGRLTVVFGAGGGRDQAKRPHMGAAASAADRILLTSDNPRSESAAEIVRQIRAGIVGAVETVVELDRAAAIQRAISDAADEDVIVIAGKGHETTQTFATETRPFSDQAFARRAHAAHHSST